MTPELRPATPADAEACGRIIFDAFREIADQHGFPWDFPSVEAGTQPARTFIAAPTIYGVVAELDGRVVGSNFVAEGDPIRGIGPITVDPSVQGSGLGRRLMDAALARADNAISVRLVQDAFNTRSISLYASIGFDVREPLLVMAPRRKRRGFSGSRREIFCFVGRCGHVDRLTQASTDRDVPTARP